MHGETLQLYLSCLWLLGSEKCYVSDNLSVPSSRVNSVMSKGWNLFIRH